MRITHNLFIKASPEEVYKAVSTQNGICGWWSDNCAIGEHEGHESTVRFEKPDGIVEMVFMNKQLHPFKKVLWECLKNDGPYWVNTRLSYELSEVEGGTQLLFAHRNFDDALEGGEEIESVRKGWDRFMSSLKNYCETGKGQPWSKDQGVPAEAN